MAANFDFGTISLGAATGTGRAHHYSEIFVKKYFSSQPYLSPNRQNF